MQKKIFLISLVVSSFLSGICAAMHTGACYIELRDKKSNAILRCVDEISRRECFLLVNKWNDEMDKDSRHKPASCIATLKKWLPDENCI